MHKLILDFDNQYENFDVKNGDIVLTNLYNNYYAINVLQNTKCRSQAFDLYKEYIKSSKNKKLLEGSQVSLFMNFFYPLTQWFSCIDRLETQGKINENTSIVFTSYSKNSRVFLFEAEGETNGQFMYKKSYFLSYYIKKYLEKKGYHNISVNKSKGIGVKLKFLFRGFIVVSIKIAQLFFYKCFVWKRNYGTHNGQGDSFLIFSSRGVIQTQFLQGMLDRINYPYVLTINESSIAPFRNLRLAKKMNKLFYYCEGYVSFLFLLKSFYNTLIPYFNNKKEIVLFNSIEINSYDLIPDLGLFNLHMDTYAESVARLIHKLKKKSNKHIRKIISFEMLSPFARFLQEKIKIDTIQIQTVGLYGGEYPQFLYGSKFFFTNLIDYNYHKKHNFYGNENIELLNNVKYMGCEKLARKKIIQKITFFCQPIHVNDEIEIIEFLKEFCQANDLEFKLKLHPRSDRLFYKQFNVLFCDATSSSKEAIIDADLVVTRTSAIAYDAWFMNVPILFFVNGTLVEKNVSFVPDDYVGTLKEIPEIDDFRRIIECALIEFYSHEMHQLYTLDEDRIREKILE